MSKLTRDEILKYYEKKYDYRERVFQSRYMETLSLLDIEKLTELYMEELVEDEMWRKKWEDNE